MNSTTLSLTLLSVTISALAQIALKLGVSSPAVQKAMASSAADGFWALAFNPRVLAGFGLYGLGAIGWLIVLSKIDVSQAYPFLGLGILITFAMGHFFLGEPASWSRIAGMMLVIAGIALVARS